MYSCAFLLLITTASISGSVIKSRIAELEGRIIGGENTNIENRSYQVSVRAFNWHICGGSILTKRLVITAAHCIYVFLPDAAHSVQYGTSVIGGNSNVISAENVVQHQDFEASNFNYDVGLIFLISEIPLNAVAKTIPIASVAPEVGQFAVITGYGDMSEGSPHATILQEVSVQIMDKTICQQQYIDINQITESMLCAGVEGGGKDACKDDSGGPMVINGELAGIISFGLGCGRPDHYGVYTNITVVKNWIELEINLDLLKA